MEGFASRISSCHVRTASSDVTSVFIICVCSTRLCDRGFWLVGGLEGMLRSTGFGVGEGCLGSFHVCGGEMCMALGNKCSFLMRIRRNGSQDLFLKHQRFSASQHGSFASSSCGLLDQNWGWRKSGICHDTPFAWGSDARQRPEIFSMPTLRRRSYTRLFICSLLQSCVIDFLGVRRTYLSGGENHLPFSPLRPTPPPCYQSKRPPPPTYPSPTALIPQISATSSPPNLPPAPYPHTNPPPKHGPLHHNHLA